MAADTPWIRSFYRSVLEIHERQLERYGGSSGIRDSAVIESAIAMPPATFGGEFLHKSIPAMAAAYLFHLGQNHGFIDGNKRNRSQRRDHVLAYERLGAGI